MSATLVRIETNERYQPAAWWREAFLRRDTCPLACRHLILGMLREWEVTVADDDAKAFRAWGEKLPGWDAGSGDEPHPFTFTIVASGNSGQ